MRPMSLSTRGAIIAKMNKAGKREPLNDFHCPARTDPNAKCDPSCDVSRAKASKATDLEPIPVEDAAPHKFEPMPGNKKPTLCNKCLERKDHANHFTDSTKTVKMADSAHKARLHRALDAVMDSTGK